MKTSAMNSTSPTGGKAAGIGQEVHSTIMNARSASPVAVAIKKLELVNSIEANALGQFSNKAKIIAPGIIALDLGVRVYDVNNVREEGGDWERAAFVESFGFAASAGAGTGIVSAGAATFLAMTPVGWAVIIVTAAGASLIANNMGKEAGDRLYDKVIKLMDFK
ncbi:MAG: hypothetical protein GXP14_02025 [Gammaproteobacteria bacterium]|nr:hypothetical protein [Gammaproteobacteria bacterium]